MVSGPDALAAELMACRAEARLSQEELARIAGVNRNTVSDMERGIRRSKPATLRFLADGLATDGAGQRDPAKADAFYDRLMRAAGYLAGQPAEPDAKVRPVEDLTDEEVEEALERWMGDPEASVAFLAFAQDWRDLSPEARRFALNGLESARDMDRAIKATQQRITGEQRARRQRS